MMQCDISFSSTDGILTAMDQKNTFTVPWHKRSILDQKFFSSSHVILKYV